jgi:hypothetical protein
VSVNTSVYVISDVHGQLGKVVALLRGAGLVGDDLAWAGGEATVWFLGDFFDGGPVGGGAVELVLRVQREAAAAGGRVQSLLGNHEVMLLAAKRFGGRLPNAPGYNLKLVWEDAGGAASDLARLTPAQVMWLTRLPAMAREGDALLIHANSPFYRDYGWSLEDVNEGITRILLGEHVPAWERLIIGFRRRRFFDDARPDGKGNAQRFLRRFGGQRIVHGHVPIATMTGQAAQNVKGPLVYAGGLCVNVDGGMSGDGAGLVYQLS